MANRVPTAITEAKGGFLTHKNRRRLNEPTTDKPIGNPPRFLSKAERKTWRELANQACPGVLMESDTIMFALFVRLTTKFTSNQELTGIERGQMISLSGKFAMNPADRSKVSVEKSKQSNLSMFLANKTVA